LARVRVSSSRPGCGLHRETRARYADEQLDTDMTGYKTAYRERRRDSEGEKMRGLENGSEENLGRLEDSPDRK